MTAEKTPRLALPFIQAAQSQKHVTVNESLVLMDSSVQPSVISVGGNTPPSAPVDGDMYVIGTAPTGLWAGQGNKVANLINGAWAFVPPFEGFRVYNQATEGDWRFTSAGSWAPQSVSPSDSWGWQNFQNTSGPLTLASAGVWYSLPNDALGALTSSAYKVSGHGVIWDASTNRLDLSDLAVGDRVHTRLDVTPTTVGTNVQISFRLLLQEGALNIPVGAGTPLYYKTSGPQEPVTLEPSFTIFNTDTRDYPVAIQAMTDIANASVDVSGWTIETRVR